MGTTRKVASIPLGLALAFAASAACGEAQQQAPDTKAPRLSERQAERISQQERLIACNRQAREARLRNAQRQEFIRACIKGDNAAVGGGEQK